MCKFGYITNFEYNYCIPLVIHCTHYNLSVCIGCITGFTLVNQTCLPSPTNCALINTANNLCITCASGYMLNVFGGCIVNNSCPNYQYRSFNGSVCLNGTIPHCKVYVSEYDCAIADDGYEVDRSLNSTSPVNATLACPNETSTIKYVIILKACVTVDLNCLYYLDNGYCYWCINGFYANNGSCFNISTSGATFINGSSGSNSGSNGNNGNPNVVITCNSD